MKHFVTLFPEAHNVHLIKEIGQIPLHMHKHFNYRSTLVCHNNDDYSYIEKEAKGLKLHLLNERNEQLFWDKAVIKYLKSHAKKIDVLNLIHLTYEGMIYGLLYKFLNPRGVLYLKLDLYPGHHKEGLKFSETHWKEAIYQMVYRLFKKRVDIVSTETEQGYQFIKQFDRKLFDKTIVLTNGIDLEKVREVADSPQFEQKQDVMLTVGHIGSEAKNSELLLEALSGIDLGNWKVKFIGAVEEHFKPAVNEFYENNPEKREQVEFLGGIYNRAELMNYYRNAKLFCLPSRWESFGFVLLEAQSMGNYIIGTDAIAPIKEITRNGELGAVVTSGNAAQLRGAIKKAMHQGFYTEALMNEITVHSMQYDWPAILKQLDTKIYNIAQSR